MTYRVFQWASGTVGRHAARVVLERPGLELVGLHVLSSAKLGQDAGALAGSADCGVMASGDIELIKRSSADVVIHAPLASMVYGENPEQDLSDICELLAAGKNVITVVGYMYPKVYGAAVVERLQRACLEGNSTFHSTGLNPGWMGDLVPLLMSALSERIDCIHVLEISSFEHYPSPEIMFDSMGFGATPEAFESSSQRRTKWLNGLFSESLQMVADGTGIAIDTINSEMTLELADVDLQTASGKVAQSTVAGQHWRWVGAAGNVPRVVHETVWRMHGSVAPHWPQGKHSVRINGSPEMLLEFEANYVSDGLLATAMHAVNAIPAVCDAKPGIATFLDLPWLLGPRAGG